MTSPVRSVVVRLSMDPSSYVAGAAKAERSTLALEAAAAKSGATAATSMERAAAGATRASGAFGGLKKTLEGLGLSMPVLGAITGGVVVKMAADYQTLVTRLETTAGELHSNLKLVGDGMLTMAGQVGLSASELAKGMYTVEQSGFRGSDALTVLKASAQGARQEGAELGKVVDAVSTVLHDYHLPASEAAHATSQLVAAISHSKTSFDDFTGAMHSVTPQAAAAGISIAQITGALAAMTASGMHADQAAQNLQSSIRSFSKMTKPMIDEISQLGLNAQDLQEHLGERGVAGTLQLISDAIVRHMGPAGQVALSAINQNKIALNDLDVMIANMPPNLAKMSAGLLDGSVSWKDYRSSVRDMSGQAAAMGTQFLGLYGSANGFSSILKSGGPAVQTYIGALGKAVGTAEGLSVALQLTGENAGAANAAIADISKAAGDAQGNIKGWDEVQATFNQRLKEAEHAFGALAITAGQELLPLLTKGLGWIADHGPQAMDALRGGISGVETVLGPFVKAGEGLVHLFGQLPGPIKDAALALAGLAIANKIGLLGALGTAVGAVGARFTTAAATVGSFSAEMAVQQRLMQMEAADAQLAAAGIGALDRAFLETAASANAATASLTNVQRMLFGLDAALAETVVAEDAATASTGRLSAAMATLQARGLSAVKTGATGLVNMFGGPWGAALAGAVIGVIALNQAFEKQKERVSAATDQILAWKKAQDAGGQAGAEATKHLDDLQKKIADLEKQIRNESGASQASIMVLKEKKQALADATKEYDKQRAAMTEVDFAQARVEQATKDLNMALKGGNPQVIAAARDRLAQATTGLAAATERQNNAQKTALQLDQEAATKSLAAVDAALGAQAAHNQLALAVEQYATDVKAGTLSSLQLKQEQFGLIDSAKQYAQNMADAAAAQAKANGATNTASTSQNAYRQALLDAATTMTGPAKDAVLQLANALADSKVVAGQAAEQMQNLGITVNKIPNSHFIEIDAPTAEQLKKLHELGYVTQTLPDGHIVVTADTNPAQTQILNMLQWARQQAIKVRAEATVDTNGPASGNGKMGTYAFGGYTGDGGKFEAAGIVHRGEFVLDQQRTREYRPLLEAMQAGRLGASTTATASPVVAQAAPVVLRTREMAGAGGGSSSAGIDYGRLAAAMAAVADRRPTVGQMVVQKESTAREAVDYLTAIARTGH